MKIIRWIVVTEIITGLGLIVPVSGQDCVPARATVTIMGQVLRDRNFYPNSSRLPIKGLEMELLVATDPGRPRATLRTDDNGVFEFRSLCPGVEYLVRPHFHPDDLTIHPPDDDTFNRHQPIRLQLGIFGRGRADFYLEPLTQNIAIRVLNSANSGIPNVRVVVVPEGRNEPQPTDANGESLIQGLPCCSRQYIVAVTKPDLFIERHVRRLILDRAQAASATFQGIPFTVVPDLTRRTWVAREGHIPVYKYREAGLELLVRGLRTERRVRENGIPELNDRIAAQSPDPGARRTQGTVVRLTVYDSTHERVPRVVGQAWQTAAQTLKRDEGRFKPILGQPRVFYMSHEGNDITHIRHHFRHPNGEEIHRCHISQLAIVEEQSPNFAEEPVPGGFPGGPEDATWRKHASRPKGSEVTLEICVQYGCDPEGCTPLLRNLGLPPVGSELLQ